MAQHQNDLPAYAAVRLAAIQLPERVPCTAPGAAGHAPATWRPLAPLSIAPQAPGQRHPRSGCWEARAVCRRRCRCRQPAATTPTAAACCLPPPASAPCSLQDYPLQPLVDDCHLLGSLLDDCLRIEVGEELFQKVRARARERGAGCMHALCSSGSLRTRGGTLSTKAQCKT